MTEPNGSSGGLTGGCYCGAVRYRCAAEPLYAVSCHCRACQRLHGAPYTAVFGAPAGALRIEGVPSTFRRDGDSGQSVLQGFCERCGSRLFSWADSLPGLVNVMIASLDDPEAVAPKIEVYARCRLAWADGASIERSFEGAFEP